MGPLHRKMQNRNIDCVSRPAIWCCHMSCKICFELQANVEAAARELSRAVQEAHVAIEPLKGMAAGNRIEGAEHSLRLAGKTLEEHQAACKEYIAKP